jgi:hypothetical protein
MASAGGGTWTLTVLRPVKAPEVLALYRPGDAKS